MTPTIYCVLFLFLIYGAVGSVNPRFYPKFHLAPSSDRGGWMNDPNGFCYFNGEYHLFYQYNPNSSLLPGIAHWAHATSLDMMNWTHLPIAMYPDEAYDKTGVFSGSALIENNTMYLFYTGNVNHPGQTPDHEQHQALAISYDGVTVTKYKNNPIIMGDDYQPNIRDPKVWKHGNSYYMVLGNSYENDTLGRVLLYTSKDMLNWEVVSVLDQSYGFLGYMWECPDFFELDGYFILLFSPQGMKSQGIKYNNLYQTGYIVGYFDYETFKFTQVSEFRELDSGHDFYATQTIEDVNGDRVMIAWADMWDQNYPEGPDGFTGQMTIPRILTLDHQLRIRQKPINQIQYAVDKLLHSGKALSDKVIPLEDKTGEIKINAPGRLDFTLIVEVNGTSAVTISYSYEQGLVTFDRGGDDGKRSAKWRPQGKLHWTVYMDSSSIEAFLGQGEVTFTSRYFPDGDVSVRVSDDSYADEMTVYSMKQTVPSPDS